MKLLLFGTVLVTATTQAWPATLAPLPVDESHSAAVRRLAKPVLESRLLDDMEQSTNWSHFGPGQMSFTTDRSKDGRQSIRLVSDTTTEKPGPVQGRPFAEAGVRRDFQDEDWSGFNRLSFWVYPTLPGFNAISLLVRFHAEGSDRWSYTHGALHHTLLKNRQWNHVVWEIPHLERTRVKGISLIYRLQGHEPGATNRVCFDFDRLELERVTPDTFEGWGVAPGQIAYSHTGYAPGAPKRALASGLPARDFEVVSPANGKVVLSKPISPATTALGEFQVMDFSELTAQSEYILRAGTATTPPFSVTEHPWADTIAATLNHFFCQRCGYEIPGIHRACHQDWSSTHAGRRISINGGWHDAGDLSQGLVNTAEAVYAMLRLSEEVHRLGLSKALEDRLRAEARWGLDWVHKTRFGDGYRTTWATMDFWTDGVPGTVDDVTAGASNGPFDNFLGAASSAVASRVFRESDPGLAEQSLRIAREDWQFGVAQLQDPGVELAAAGAQASLELYRATGESVYADQACDLARVLVDSQQQTRTQWALPLAGFFFTSPRKERLLHYNHRSHEQAPVVVLAELCETLPRHADWASWYASVVLFSEYLKTAARVTAPFHPTPAGIYRLNEAKDSNAREQVSRGVRLDADHYLRRFPVWGDFRGNLGVQLSHAKALSAAARLRRDAASFELAQEQLEWVLGRNPFGQSLMYGVGHNYPPLYTAMSGDIAGGLPVGIQTRRNEDLPYWPAANCYNYAEIWVHPSSRWLAIMTDLLSPLSTSAKPEIAVSLRQTDASDGLIRLTGTAIGRGNHELHLRAFNLATDSPVRRVRLQPGQSGELTWAARIIDAEKPWVAVVVLDGDVAQRLELLGNWQ